MLQAVGSQRVGHDLATEQQQQGETPFPTLTGCFCFRLELRKTPGLWNGEDVGGQAQKPRLRVPRGLWGSQVQGLLGDTLNFFSSREWRAGNGSGQGMGLPRSRSTPAGTLAKQARA